MKKFFLPFLVIISSFNLFLSAQDTENLPKPEYDSADTQLWVDSVLTSLTLEEQIAQLLMIRTYSNKDERYYKKMDHLVTKYKLGGLCFFQGGPVMQAKLTNRYQELAKTPLFIGMDAEWGLGMRLDSTFSFPFQMTLGASNDDSLLYRMGKEIARQLQLLGVHMNFAPVVDINNNPDNPVINSRSFGEKREQVASKSSAYMKGLQDNGIIATAKHFPGHGDTDSDSHLTLPIIKHSKSRLDSIELYPFRKLIHNGLKAIMVAHLYIPALDSSANTPTTLSSKVVNDLLKKELGFKGLVVTDALDMKGVTSHFKPGEIEVKAFQAGNDILLLPQDIALAIKGIMNAVESGIILEEQIKERCRKILTQKHESGLAAYKPVETDSIYFKVNEINNELLSRLLYEKSIVVIRNDTALIPLKNLDTLHVASLSLGTGELTPFQQMLSKYVQTDHFNALKNITGNQQQNLLSRLSAYNLVIVGIHNTSIFPNRNFGISQNNVELLNKLSDSANLILVLFSSPYSLDLIDLKSNNLSAIILAHQDTRISNEIAAQIIMGSIKGTGKLPVSNRVDYPPGFGIKTKAINRLKYTIPEEVGIHSITLQKIDSIALLSIREKEIPGCQILVAKDGKVIYQKSFGYHTYKKGRFVKNTDIYDLASITKVAATTLSIMRLYDQRMLDIDHKLVWYLPYLNGTNKENIILRELMAHQSKLKPWIPFYLNTLNKGTPDKKYYNRSLDENHTVKVAKDLYINSEYSFILYDSIIHSGLRNKNNYLYSDLGFYLLKQAIENLTNKPLDKYVEDEFYTSLGLQYTGFNPLNRIKLNQIIPTEKDNYFRYQLVHGYVHDPGAAMLGGVAGHAGLFSTSNDLAILMQMLLNGGQYGGVKYIRSGTVSQFAKQQFPLNENRRGIGFDKQDPIDWEKGPTCESASLLSFGHTGFTGTYTWVDPEYNLIYIFLSNRVYPTANNTKLIRNNTRTKIHQVIYDALPEHQEKEVDNEELGILPFVK